MGYDIMGGHPHHGPNQ
jgi:hypothetical protein